MEWVLHYLPRHAVLLARIVGDYQTDASQLFLQALSLACQQHSPQAVLIDRRRSALKFSTMNIYAHPEEYRQAGISPSARIALVVTGISEDERFLETVFRNRGYNMKIFDNWRCAVAWARAWRRLV